MAQPVITVRESTSLTEVARIMLEKRIGCLPVVNAQERLIGIITESDFAAKEKGVPFSTFHAPQVLGKWMGNEGIERIYAAARQMTAQEIMHPQVVTVTEGQPIDQVVELMLQHDINRVPVVRDDVPVGIVARHDLLRMMVAHDSGAKKSSGEQAIDQSPS